MPGGNYEDLFNYSKEYYTKFYGGKPGIGAYSDAYYASQNAMLERRRKKMISRLRDETSGLREGYMPSGLDMQIQTEQVETPIAEAEAALDYQKLMGEENERIRREGIARNMALAKIEEQKAAAQKRGSFWGKLLPGLAGAAIGTFINPGAGTLAGWGIGSGIGGAFMGGGNEGDGGYNSLYEQYYQQALKDLVQNSQVAENPYDPNQSGIDATWDPETKRWVRW